MKRFYLLFYLLLCYVLVLILKLKSEGAIISDNCSACHVPYPGMMEEVALVKAKYKYLLDDSLCVECHSSSDNATIKIVGGVKVPIVYNKVPPEKPLAGGNFYYVTKSDRKGHNVGRIASMDKKFKGFPPGYDRETDQSIIGYNPEKPLTCAGSNGCHGDRNIENPFESIRKSHHAKDRPIDGTTTAKSYRFLKGVKGYEDEEWNQNASAKKHNEYTSDIDKLCANCHGKFYKKDFLGKESPWFRHPVDIPLPDKGEYIKYLKYNPNAPVARQKVFSSPSEEVKPGEDKVTCLSCHVAHGSHYDSILRWDYDNIYTHEGQKEGCLICHTGKQD